MADPENNIVREWLRTLDLSHHLDNFIDNGYDDLETCKQIGEEDMDAIGVQEPRQREDLRQAVARLKQEGGTAVYFTLMGPETDYIYEEDVVVDYGYAEDEDEKVHSLINGGSGGICDCRNCECLQENHFEVQPQCYLDRHRWKWTEHHLRRGSFEGATEYRRMMTEHPNADVLVNKPRSSSAVERGGFVEAIGGMSPQEQQRRMFRSLKDSGRNQHSGSSLTSTGSDSSSGPTSPELVMSAGAEDGAASGDASETKKGRSRSLKSLFKNLIRSPGEQQKAEGTSAKQGQGVDVGWKANESNLTNETILKTWDLIKEQNLSPEEAWTKAMEMEAEEKRKKESNLSPTMTQLSPAPLGKSPQQMRTKSISQSNGSRSAAESPITPSDSDSARGTEGATGSDESPRSIHNYYEPPESFPGLIRHGGSSDLEDRPVIPEKSRLDPRADRASDSAIKSEDEDGVLTTLPQPGVIWGEEGLTFKNGHAEMISPSHEQLPSSGATRGLARADSADLEHLRRKVKGIGGSGGISPDQEDKGEYLQPAKSVPIVHGIPKRHRAKSSPALAVGYFAGSYGSLLKKSLKDPSSVKGGKSLTERIKFLTRTSHNKASPSSTPSPDGSGIEQRFSETSDGSMEQDGTLSSSTSNSSKSSGEVETKRPTYEVEPHLLDSKGAYTGPYQDIAIVTQDASPNPHDVDMLPLVTGDMVYVTKRHGGYWEGICGKRRGKFKFIHVCVMTTEELEKLKMEVIDDVTPSEVMPKFANLKELLERIECEQYYSVLHLHDFGSLEQFKFLEEADLDALNITDRKHIVQLTTAAQMLRDPKAGKARAASQQLHGLLWPTRKPKGRLIVRDSGFYASTETCVSIDSSGLHNRCSEAGDSLIEECETGYPDDDGVTSSSDETLQENSNVNNSNCINAVRNQNGTSRMGNLPCRHSVTPPKSNHNFGNGHPLSSSPSCPRKEGNGSASPLAHHICRVHTNGAAMKCAQQHQFLQQSATSNPSWNGPTPHRDSPLFKHRHLMATFSDPGSAPSSPRLRLTQKLPHRCPLQTGCSVDHQCPSPDVVPKVSSGDIARWRKSALIEMYSIQDPSRLRGSGSFIQSSLSKTHPSPKLPRRALQQYHCQALQSVPIHPASSNQQKGRRKSRSVSPQHHKHRHHHHHHELLLSQNSVHGSPTLPLRPSNSSRQQASAQLEWLVERSLRQEGIDLKEEPYSNKMGFCGIPPALVQRYAEELESEVAEVAICLESIRVRELVDACRCWFRSDALASQSSKVVYAGTGNSIEDWLTSLGLPLYIEAFTLSGWDELDIVIHMDKEDLRKCGIDRAGHLRRLSTALEHLKMSWKPV